MAQHRATAARNRLVTTDTSTDQAGIAVVDRRRLTLDGLVGFLMLFAIGNYLLPLGRLPTHWWSDVFWTVASLAAALKCFAASRAAAAPLRRSWQLFALACFSWFVGMLIWDYQELVLHRFTRLSQPSSSSQPATVSGARPSARKSWNRYSMPCRSSHLRAFFTVSQFFMP